MKLSRFALGLTLTFAPLAQAETGDVYNFYFQKGGAPQTVIQGGGGQTAASPVAPQPAPAPAPQPAPVVQPLPSQVVVTNAPPQPALVPVQDYKRFELLLGPSYISDDIGTAGAYTVGAQINFNRYLGTRLLGYRIATESARYANGMKSEYLKDENAPANLYGGQLSLVFTPIHIDLMGQKLVRVSALAGLMSQRKYDVDPGDAYISGDINGFIYHPAVATKIRPFAGASVGVALNENVSVEASVAMLDGGKIGQSNASVVFSF